MNIILFDKRPEEDLIPMSDERARHMKKILKVVPGDQVLMGLIDGLMGNATVKEISEEGVRIDWEPTLESTPFSPVELVVAQVRPICMKRILREAVSLGVRKIHVVGADTAEKSYARSHLWTKGEYKSYLLHGATQSVSTKIPECITYRSVDQLDFDDIPTRILLDNIHPAGDIMDIPISEPVVLAIGPERGWTDRERAVFTDRGFCSVGMGDRVLRTETACSAGLGIIIGRLRLVALETHL